MTQETRKIEVVPYDSSKLVLRPLMTKDIPCIVKAFKEIGWQKPATLYEEYLEEQKQEERQVVLAEVDGIFVGYVTLKWHSDYPLFQKEEIPEIKDLNVLPAYRRNVIGSALLSYVEEVAFTKVSKVGLGVGVFADYQDAFRLYLGRGYQLDGRGLYHPLLPHKFAKYGDQVMIDDDCNLWLIKRRNTCT